MTKPTGERTSARSYLGRWALFVCLPLVVLFLPPVAARYLLPALSPFVGLCSSLAARAIGLSLLLSLPMLFFILWRRRAFCRYLCPVGLIVEGCAKARGSARRSYRSVPPLGHWAVLLTFAGALAACPLLLFLDPVALYVGAFGVFGGTSVFSRIGCGAGLALIVAISLIYPWLWCARLCPLGATQVLFRNLADALKSRRRRRKGTDAPGAAAVVLPRRDFIAVGVGLGASLAAGRLEGNSAPVRPPGSVAEPSLRALCVRCGNCARACPSGIVLPDLGPSGVTGFLLPRIDFTRGFCRHDCNRCGRSCPTGAIASLALDEKNRRPIGLAEVNRNRCMLSSEMECSACVQVCRYGAIDQAFSRETYSTIARVDASRCNGCGQCLAICPTRAISIAPLRSSCS